MKDDNVLLAVDLINRDITTDGHVVVPRGTLQIFRTKLLWQGRCYERLRIDNYGLMSVDVPLYLQCHGDFADTFEVRGLRREHRGYRREGVVKHDGIMLAYEGLDGVTRRTWLRCSPAPTEASGSQLRLDIKLPPKGEVTFDLTVSCESTSPIPSRAPFDYALLPELFCGFPRRPGEGPTLYPVACAPQSWAAASVFMLLQACTGLSIHGSPPQISFSYPLLPPFLREVQIKQLRVGRGSVDLLLRRHGDDVSIDRRAGDVVILNVK